MSLQLANLLSEATTKKRTREQTIALQPAKEYNDGRTKQCHKDECDISKIMARFQVSGTISHVSQYQGVYADFSNFDFFEQTQMLTKGREVFDALPAEVRREFSQSPAKFFEFVNDPANADDLLVKLPALAKPGDQLPKPKAGTQPTVPVEPTPDPDPEPEPEPGS